LKIRAELVIEILIETLLGLISKNCLPMIKTRSYRSEQLRCPLRFVTSSHMDQEAPDQRLRIDSNF
jgi:hypothetical protein